MLLDRTSDKVSYKQIEKVYDLCNSSPIKSHQDIVSIENEISTLIWKLGSLVAAADTDNISLTTHTLMDLFQERNIKVRSL